MYKRLGIALCLGWWSGVGLCPLLVKDSKAYQMRRRSGSASVATFKSDTFNTNADPIPTANGITWTQTTANLDGANSLRVNSNGVDPNGSFNTYGAMAQFGTRSTAQYSCAKVTATPVNGERETVCVGMTNGGTTANDAICCGFVRTGVPSDLVLDVQTIDDTQSINSHATDTQTAPFYIGAERIDSTTFKCWKSTDGSTWTLTQTLSAISNINTPGDVGLWMTSDQFSSMRLDDWQGGDGNPMTGTWTNTYANPCGQN